MTAICAMLLSAALASAVDNPQTRRVYVNALDRDGNSVDDLTVADFTVKEGGKTRAILRAEPALSKMQIAIIVDDNGTGLLPVAGGRCIEARPRRAQVAVRTGH